MKTKVVHIKDNYDVYIGRPSKYGNPFTIGEDGDRDTCIQKYEIWLNSQPDLIKDMQTNLKGKTLGCWCKPKRCHGDIIIEICDKEDNFYY